MVVRGEANRNEGLDEVESVMERDKEEPGKEGCAMVDGIGLGNEGENGGSSRKYEEGKFFKDGAAESGQGEGAIKGDATERKHVEEEEEEGEGDEHGLDQKPEEEGKGGEGEEEARPRGGAVGIEGAEVGEGGEEGEDGGESVLALSDPGDGFDAEGMKGPEQGEESGGESRGAATTEEKVKKACGEGVEEDVREVKGPGRGGSCMEEGTVGHEGDPEERGVHGCVAMEGCEGGTEGGEGKSVEDEVVAGDEGHVIVVGERVADRGGEEGEGEEEDEKRGKERAKTERVFHGS